MSNFSYEEFNTDLNEEIADDDAHILMHLDIDYFFAQVELLKRPEMVDLPVIIGHEKSRETGRGVVLTCNYPARKFGVHSGQAMKIALDKCPQAIILGSHYEDYSHYSKIIMSVLKALEVPMRKAGIDEAYVDLTPIVENYAEAKELGLRIKEEILAKTKLTVSIGIGPTLKIAKIGSDYDKPDGISVFPPDQLETLFRDLPLIKVPGIGKKTFERLQEKGFTTCGQLMVMTKAELVDYFGNTGEYYYNIFTGQTTNAIHPRGKRKSVSHSRTFVGDPGDIETSMNIINKLFESTYSTLVKENFLTKTVGVTVRFNGFDTITRAQTLPYVTENRDHLYNIVIELVSPYLADERGIRLLGVGFHNLEEKEENQRKLSEFIGGSGESTDTMEFLKQLSGGEKRNNIASSKTSPKKKKGKDSGNASLDDFM